MAEWFRATGWKDPGSRLGSDPAVYFVSKFDFKYFKYFDDARRFSLAGGLGGCF